MQTSFISTPPSPHALPACLAEAEQGGGGGRDDGVWVFCRGYPLVNVTCLSATLPLVNCPDYYCDNVAIKKEALHQNGRGGLWSERWMCTDYKAVGNALRWQSILTPPLSSSKAAGYYRPSSLISIPNQYSSAAVKIGVNQHAAGERSDVREEKSKGGS